MKLFPAPKEKGILVRLKSALALSVQSGCSRLWNVCGASVTPTFGSLMHGAIMLKISGLTCIAQQKRFDNNEILQHYPAVSWN